MHLLTVLFAGVNCPQVNSTSPICPGGLPTPATDQTSISTLLSLVFGVVGALALLVITISGLRYVLSSGDPQKTAQAKNGIIYALIGLVISLSAEAIVAFVAGNL